jgi:hypothetical protein
MNYEELYNKYKNKYINLKYKLDGGIFTFTGGQLYIMIDIIDSNIIKKLNTLKKTHFPDSNKNKAYHITLFNINFNINYVKFNLVKKIIKSLEFTKYVNNKFLKIYKDLELNIEKKFKILGRILNTGYDGRFVTLHFEQNKNNGILIEQFRNDIIKYILTEIKVIYNKQHFYPNIRNPDYTPKENNHFWIYSNKHISEYDNKKKTEWNKDNVIFAINKFSYPFKMWTPHISILSFQEIDNINESSVESLKIVRLDNMIFKNLNVEIYISLRIKNEKDKWKYLIYKKINNEYEIFYGNYESIDQKDDSIKLKNLNFETFVEGDHIFIESNDHNIDNYDYYKLILNKNSIIDKGKLTKIDKKPTNNVYVHQKR